MYVRHSLNSNHHLVKFFPCFVGGEKGQPSTSSYHFCVINSRQMPAQIFVSSQKSYEIQFPWQIYDMDFIAIFIIFHCCPGQYFIPCLGRYILYFIAARAIFHSLPRWYFIAARVIFHSLPNAIFIIFHCCPGQYFIATQGNIYYISLLPRVIFHCYPGQYLLYFIAARAIFHSLPRVIFHCCQGDISFFA